MPSRALTVNNIQCKYCGQMHLIYKCFKFLKLSVQDRISVVKKHSLCIICVKDHSVKDCEASCCKICNKKHNTLLHIDSFKSNTNQIDTNSSKTITSESVTLQNRVISKSQSNKITLVLLPTAVIHVLDKIGKRHFCRVLLDSGSQSNFMTERMSQILRLKKEKIHFPIGGIGNSIKNVRFQTRVEIRTRINMFSHVCCWLG